ncbi:MAG: hypothetical protein WD768_08125 [Phycisphaeraceae bacterium]
MMMSTGFGFMEMLILLLGGGGGINLPVGLPPTPEDPKMAQVAPAECIAYITWAGTADADPKSANRAERILAEPQVRHLFKTIEDEIFALIDRETGNNKEEKQALSTIASLVKLSLTHPTAIYLSKFDAGENGLDVEAGMVINLGDKAAQMEKMLLALEAMLPDRAGKVQVIDGMRRIPTSPDAPPVGYTFKGNYLLVAIGKETQTALPKALDNGPVGGPDWLKTARGKVAVKRTSSFIYINAAPLRDQIIPTFVMGMRQRGEAPQYRNTLAALGLDKLTAIIISTGFDDEGFVSKTLLATKDNPGGLFTLFNKKPLTPADLADVPKDADLAFVVRLNASEIFDEVFKGVGMVEPRAAQEMKDELADAERELGFKIKEDLLDSLGDVWSIYNSPGEGGLIITGLTGVVQVKDRAKAKKAIDRIADTLNKEANRNFDPNGGRWQRRQYQFKSMDFMGHSIQYINPIGDDWVVTPAWCLTEDRFVIAPYPQMIKAYLARRSKADAGSLADAAAIKGVMKNSGGPGMITYTDTPDLFKKVYPLASPLVTLLCSQLQRETGMKLDASLLPTASSILPHLKADVSTVTNGADGVMMESRQSIPLMGTLTSLPMMAMMLWVSESRMMYDAPAIAVARADHEHGHEVAPVRPPAVPVRPVEPRNQRVAAMNELRNIGVGVFLYHAETKKAPATLKDLTPKYMKKVGPDPWGQEYVYFGKDQTPAGAGSDKIPLAATSHLVSNMRIVLYGDGHVEMVEEKPFKEQLEKSKLPYAKPAVIQGHDDAKEDSHDAPKDAPRSSPRPTLPPRPEPSKDGNKESRKGADRGRTERIDQLATLVAVTEPSDEEEEFVPPRMNWCGSGPLQLIEQP